MTDTLLQLPSTISKIITMGNHALRLQVDTQENIDNKVMAKILSLYNKLGYFCFLVGDKKIQAEQLVDLPELKTEDEKTPSQRLRNRMFVYYKETHTDTSKFNIWYEQTIDKIGQKYLDKLD